MSKEMGPYGGDKGRIFNDGAYDSVRKVCVREDGDRVCYVEFEYGKGDILITQCYGKKTQERKELVLDYERDEYINYVEGTYDEDGFVSSLTFITSLARDRKQFGKVGRNKFILKAKGFDKIVGFTVRMTSDERITALGAYFAVVVTPPVKKLEGVGGDYGLEEWDDGVHDNVRKITITSSYSKVKSVRFEYLNRTSPHVVGHVHGDFDRADKKKEIMLKEDEYVTSVSGFYGEKYPNGDPHIAMLFFKTNKNAYQVLGYTDDYKGDTFYLGLDDHKIVGFHGISTVDVEQIGVYVKPINSS